jgi:predicted MFS family arabinose efflux permease
MGAPAPPIAAALVALCLGHVFSNAVRTLPAIAADVLMRDLGIDAETLAQITGAFPLAFAAVMIPVGIALDRHGVRRIAFGLLAIAGLGAAMAALATGPGSMLAAQIVLGAGCSGMLMCPITFAARRLSGPAFAAWSGIILAIGNTGMLLSASPLALLIEAADWRAGFWACLGLAAIALASVALLVPPDPPPATPPRSLARELAEVWRMLRLPAVRPVLVIVFASLAGMLGLRGLWGGPWLMEVKGLDRIEAGNLLLACTVALAAGPALAGLLLARIGRPVLLLGGSHLGAGLLILLLIAGGPGGASSRAAGLEQMPAGYDLAVLVAFGLIISGQMICFTLVRASVPAEEAGRALSATNLVFFLGAAALQALSGVAASRGGVAAALATFALALIGCAALFLMLARPRRGR